VPPPKSGSASRSDSLCPRVFAVIEAQRVDGRAARRAARRSVDVKADEEVRFVRDGSAAIGIDAAVVFMRRHSQAQPVLDDG
jgi:hypothetical protein